MEFSYVDFGFLMDVDFQRAKGMPWVCLHMVDKYTQKAKQDAVARDALTAQVGVAVATGNAGDEAVYRPWMRFHEERVATQEAKADFWRALLPPEASEPDPEPQPEPDRDPESDPVVEPAEPDSDTQVPPDEE
ncbi:MAG: hypothetical protein V3S01_05575 [Dehalococcoidia bacterium]